MAHKIVLILRKQQKNVDFSDLSALFDTHLKKQFLHQSSPFLMPIVTNKTHLVLEHI